MHTSVKSCISYNHQTTKYFNCEIGVRQVENLFPFLFSMFTDTNIIGLTSITEELENELGIYLKIFVMLYADDTFVLAESVEDFQVQLNSFREYCNN
jgi:hypothetical protein